jgi:CubicO group peptidase (beta-lactamase class C family)
MSDVDGSVAAGFEPVRTAFQRNLDEGLDVGAGVAVYRDGRPVVDLWGGAFDAASSAPYGKDTLQLVFSTTKGAAAICVGICADRGLIDYDAPVAAYWPEFAAAGKADITVAQLMAHQAGLVTVDAVLTLADVPADSTAPSDWTAPTCRSTRVPCTPPRSRPSTASPTPSRWHGCTRRASGTSTASASCPPRSSSGPVPRSTRATTAAWAVETTFGLGFMTSGPFTPMLGPSSFGHPGAGGSLGFTDSDSGIAFGYVMNKMEMNLAGDPRVQTLLDALRSCL